MHTDIRLPQHRHTTSRTRARVILVDGFGQPTDSPVTHEVAAALAAAFPHATIRRPVATAIPVGEDITLQLGFAAQAGRIHAAITASTAPTHVYAYSQGCIPTAAVLAATRYPHVASVMLVGTPLRASWERRRIADLDATGMGGVYEYVEPHLPAGTELAGVVVFEPASRDRAYVGITTDYATGFPRDDTHYRNLAATIRDYPTTLVVCGAENVTDCTPTNAAVFAAAVGIRLAAHTTTPRGLGSRAVVIPGAPHRLGRVHRTVTVPELYRRRTTLRALAGTRS